MQAKTYKTPANFDNTAHHFTIETVSSEYYLKIGNQNEFDTRLLKSLLAGGHLGFFTATGTLVVYVEITSEWDNTNSRIKVASIPSELTADTDYRLRTSQARPGLDGESDPAPAAEIGHDLSDWTGIEIITTAKRVWTPTVTGTDITASNVLASEIEVDGLHQFAIEAVLDKTGTWAIVTPEFSLPSGVGTPSVVRGNIVGYGGSEMKFFETMFSQTIVNDGVITGGVNAIKDATVHNNTVYLCKSSGLVYTLNLSTRVATQYVNTGNHNWGAIASDGTNLYGWNNNNPQTLYTITSSGETQIGANRSQSLNSMTFLNNILYASNSSQLYTINKTTGEPTLIGSYSPVAEIHALFTINDGLYGIDINTPDEIWKINVSNATVTEQYNWNIAGVIAAFVDNDKLYGIHGSGTGTLRSLELNVPPLTSVDFSGANYTSAIGQCFLSNNKIGMNIEKLQKNDDEIFIQATGQYQTS